MTGGELGCELSRRLCPQYSDPDVAVCAVRKIIFDFALKIGSITKSEVGSLDAYGAVTPEIGTVTTELSFSVRVTSPAKTPEAQLGCAVR